MTEAVVQFDEAGLGKWTDPVEFEVTRERLVQYAAATNDPIPAHRDGDVASPVFGIVPVFHALLAPALEVVPVSLFGKILHGEQDFRFHRPIVPGDRLTARGKMTGWEGLENGTRACVYLESRDGAGELVNEQYVTFFVRGFDDGRRLGELSSSHRLDPALRSEVPAASFTQRIDGDQTFRYAEASGDPMPIHLDEDAAEQAGLPGIIAHGFCVLAFTCWGLMEGLGREETGRLRRLACRFAKPVLPGQEIQTKAWATGLSGSDSAFAFETAVGETLVIRDGLAEFTETT
ncbi:MAG: MaoC family dehydratase N-terminal domain-containing protein [Solirubrobacterales bacterium]|nr:MaoC family dehydratase N-terminal domain-containing protein [Solirubrobacterales bacterium]